MSGSAGTALGSDPLYGTTCTSLTASGGRPKILPTFSACSLVRVIWPRQAAVTHSFDSPTFFATSDHLISFRTFAEWMRSVTSSRVIGLWKATSATAWVSASDRFMGSPGSFHLLEEG